MKIFVAGATGVVGSRLVPVLVDRGHEVVGTTRTPTKMERLRALGAAPVLMDAFDPPAVTAAVMEAAPDVVVNELTAIPETFDLRRFDEAFAETNRLRTEGTDHLLAGARAAGVRRVVAQSYAAWPYERRGSSVKTEEDPFDETPPRVMAPAMEALRHLEAGTLAFPEGVVLRYGAFYGPGTSISADGSMVDAVRARRMPVVGSGAGVFSFVHVDDVAAATALAIERAASGIYNVADDEPARVREWLPILAEAVGASSPRRVPAWLARPLIGEAGISMMTEVRGASNAKAKRELGWTPRYASWRIGFLRGLGGAEDRAA